jgi:tetratricopeptide (TPR) repeat protein
VSRSREELEARLAELRAETAMRLAPVMLRDETILPSNDNGTDNVIHVTFGLNPLRAFALYSQAAAIDEDPARLAEAEALYREALRCDPRLAVAMTNLGNVRLQRGDEEEALALYREAIAIDDRQPEAPYNLGCVLLEGGDARGAIDALRRSVELDPCFGDAIFNLASAYEHVRDRRNARPLWKRYLDLNPSGPWSEIAARHLSGDIYRTRGTR